MKETTLKEAKEEFLQFFYNDIYWRYTKKYSASDLKKLREKDDLQLYDWEIIDDYYKELIGRYGKGRFNPIFRQSDYEDALQYGYSSIKEKLEGRKAAPKSKVRPQLKF